MNQRIDSVSGNKYMPSFSIAPQVFVYESNACALGKNVIIVEKKGSLFQLITSFERYLASFSIFFVAFKKGKRVIIDHDLKQPTSNDIRF